MSNTEGQVEVHSFSIGDTSDFRNFALSVRPCFDIFAEDFWIIRPREEAAASNLSWETQKGGGFTTHLPLKLRSYRGVIRHEDSVLVGSFHP